MGGVVDTLFGGGAGAGAKDLQKYIGQGMDARKEWEGKAENALSPYMGDPRLQNEYEKAIAEGADPSAVYNHIMSSYQQSPFAKTETEAGMNAINAGGAANGMRGSGQEMKDLQENSQKISSADMQDYLSKMLGIKSDYLNRLGGIAGNESQQQYGARGQIGNWRYGTGNNLAEDYGHMGQAKENEDIARAGGWNKFASKIPLVGGLF